MKQITKIALGGYCYKTHLSDYLFLEAAYE